MKNTLLITTVILILSIISCKKENNQSNNNNTSTGTVPTVSTLSVSGIGTVSVISGGNITSENGSAITAVGLCWGTSPNPTTLGTHSNNGAGIGTFTYQITSLSPNTTYFIRAYATNGAGTAYGNEISFQTLQDSCSLRTYTNSVKKVFDDYCIGCHLTSSPAGGVDLSNYSGAIATNTAYLQGRITSTVTPMPPTGLMAQNEIDKILCWIQNGRP